MPAAVRYVCAFVVVIAAMLALADSASAAASFRPLGSLASGANFVSEAAAVSGDGSVVVGFTAVPGGGFEAFRWSIDTGMQALGDLPGLSHHSQGYGVNATGTVIVGYSNNNMAFRWTASAGMQPLGYFPGGLPLSIAHDVDAIGHFVVGYGKSAQSGMNNEAFRWAVNTGFQGQGDLPGSYFESAAYAVNYFGTAWVGESRSSDGHRAVLWTNAGDLVDLGPGRAHGVDALGDTVVGNSGGKPFRWTRTGGFAELPTLPGSSNGGVAYDVSADGQVVIGYSSSIESPGFGAFVWTPTTGTRSLREILISNGIDMTGWSLDIALGISYDGTTIVGYGTNPDGRKEAYVATIPEPSGPMLALLTLLVCVRRHRMVKI